MRIVFIGADRTTVATARRLVGRGHEVVIVERDKAKIDELSETLDCGFIHGDGSRPDVLREVGPEQTDFLFCMTDDDQDNILASLVGESLGFKRVVTSIADQQYDPICRELGLTDTINPSYTISRYLTDMVGGVDAFELSSALKYSARLFTFVAAKEDAVTVGDLNLPTQSQAICYYRNETFHLAGADTALKEGDEVVVLTHEKNLQELRERWSPKKTI